MTALPRLMTAKQAAAYLGIKERTVRTLRESGQLAYVLVAGRPMYTPCDLDAFITNSKVEPCQDQTKGRASSRSISEAAPTMSVGPKMDAATSKARVAAITTKLKSGLRTGSENKPVLAAPVIQGSFR